MLKTWAIYDNKRESFFDLNGTSESYALTPVHNYLKETTANRQLDMLQKTYPEKDLSVICVS